MLMAPLFVAEVFIECCNASLIIVFLAQQAGYTQQEIINAGALIAEMYDMLSAKAGTEALLVQNNRQFQQGSVKCLR